MVDLIIKQNPTIDWLFSYKDILKKHLHQELLQDLPAFILDEIQIEPSQMKTRFNKIYEGKSNQIAKILSSQKFRIKRPLNNDLHECIVYKVFREL